MLAAMLLAGCGDNPAALHNPLKPAAPALLNIPFPDDRAAAGLTEYQLLGKQTELRSAGAVDTGNALSLTASAAASAFGLYRFHPLSAPEHVKVSLGGGTSGVWVGLADYTTQRWVFQGPYTGTEEFTLSSAANVSPLGNIHLAMLVGPGGHAVVDQVQVFAANIPPTADFVPSPATGLRPLPVDFDAAASADGDGNIARYEWDFDNDGVYETDGGDQPQVQHTFTTAGTHHVSLRTTDSSGDSDTHSADISVLDPPPTASFTVTPQQQVNPLVLNYVFDASASSDPDGAPLAYDWDFDGDGNWDIEDGPAVENHSYANIGVYPARLRVTSQFNLSDEASQTVYCPSVWSSFNGPPGCTTRQSPVVGPQTNHVKWTFPTGGYVQSSPAIGPDGTVYISSSGVDARLYALADNGTPTPSVKWSFPLSAGNHYSTAAVGADGTVYVADGGDTTYALADNGTPTPTIKWSYPTGPVIGDPCLGPDGTVYVGNAVPTGGTFYALADNGTPTPTLKWSFSTSRGIACSAALGPDGTVYVGSDDNNLYALADNGTATPTVKWSFTTGHDVQSTPAIGPDGTVYVGSFDRKVYALVDNGSPTPTVKWSYTTGGGGIESSPAVGPDGTIYIGSDDNKIYALADNGSTTPTVKWSFNSGGTIGAQSPVIAQDGTIYIGSDNGKFYALADNGTATPTVKWNYTTGGYIPASAALGHDGTLYCGDMDFKVYAFGP
jgi:outer membrane protein assembly factor BamB